MLKRLLLVLAVLVASLHFGPVAQASGEGGWLNVCPLAGSLPDDPIVYPGQPGASHLHNFFGTLAPADATVASMRASTTTCIAADTAGYWAPAVYRNGVLIDPNRSTPQGGTPREQIYYRRHNLNDSVVIRPMPVGLKMVVGNSKATSLAQNPLLGTEHLYWGCSDNSQDQHWKYPPSCSTGINSLHIEFPNCWNGTDLDQHAVPSAVVYPVNGRCPASNPIALPQIFERWEYPVGTSASGVTLSSGPVYTTHADLFNTWHQFKLKSLVTNCLNKLIDCGNFERP